MDLHIHSDLSADGIKPVQEILKMAQEQKVDVLSITDHDTALAHIVIEHINLPKIYSGRVVSGVEIDVCENGTTFEILAYDFDVHPVQDWLYKKFGTVDKRQKRIQEKLLKLCEQKGFKVDKNFPWDAKAEFAHINIYRNIMQYSENEKLWGCVIADGSDFYRNSTTNQNFPLYMDMDFLWASVDEVNEVIHKNGGKTFLAHSFGYRKDFDTKTILDLCMKKGVDGIEVYHPKHSAEQIKFLLDYCHKNNLLISGGSDSHWKEPTDHFAQGLTGKLFIK